MWQWNRWNPQVCSAWQAYSRFFSQAEEVACRLFTRRSFGRSGFFPVRHFIPSHLRRSRFGNALLQKFRIGHSKR